MAFNELSPMMWLAIGIVSLIVTGVVMLFVINLQVNLNEGIQDIDSEAVPQKVKDFHQAQTTQTSTILDYAFLGLFVSLALSVILVARSTTISPFWTVFIFIILVFVIIIAAFTSNFAYDIDEAGNLEMETYMPITYHLTDNAVWYVMAIGLAAMMFARGSPGRDF